MGDCVEANTVADSPTLWHVLVARRHTHTITLIESGNAENTFLPL